MSDGFFSALALCGRVIVLAVLVAGGVLSKDSVAQSPSPTVIDFWTKSDTLFLEISLNAEAFVAGLDPTATPDVANNGQYRKLRATVSSELEPEVKAFTIDWMQTLHVEVGEPILLDYEGVSIPAVGDPDSVRVSKLLLTGPLPDGASSLRLTWPAGSGPVVLKQQHVAAPYSGYLEAGQTSPLIPLLGGASLTTQQTLQAYFAKGVAQVSATWYTQGLLVLALVFLSLNPRFVVAQMLFFSLGLVVGFGGGLLNWINVPPTIAVQASSVAIVVVSLWNLILRRLQVWRLLVVLAMGLLQGVILSAALRGMGVPPDHIAPAIFGFGAGVLLALWCAAAAAFGIGAVMSGRSERLRDRISATVSILIAAAGVYLIVTPLLVA